MEKTRVERIAISGSVIRLDQFLKWAGLASTGGHAKELIQSGYVLVNGEIETQRGRKLKSGDKVEVENVEGIVYEVTEDAEYAPCLLYTSLSRELTEASLPRIGDEFGGRDHTTVMHACSKIQDDIQQDPALAASVKEIISKLKEMT